MQHVFRIETWNEWMIKDCVFRIGQLVLHVQNVSAKFILCEEV